MKHFKLISTIVMLALVVFLLGFGVYSAAMASNGISNNVKFDTGSKNVFVKINGSYSGPTLTSNGAQATYYYELNKNNSAAYGDEKVNINPWYLGATNFTSTETVISLTFTFENLNNESELDIDISDVAFDADQKFTTSYIAVNAEDALLTTNPTLISSAEENGKAVIPTQTTTFGEKLYIKIIYELKKFDTNFQLDNNINVLLTNNVLEEA